MPKNVQGFALCYFQGKETAFLIKKSLNIVLPEDVPNSLSEHYLIKLNISVNPHR
jgi:hypothetical protein